MKNNETITPQIGQNAKKMVLQDVRNIEAAVFALVSSIETRMSIAALPDGGDEEATVINGADFFLVDDKALMEVLCQSCSELFSIIKTHLGEMTTFRELN